MVGVGSPHICNRPVLNGRRDDVLHEVFVTTAGSLALEVVEREQHQPSPQRMTAEAQVGCSDQLVDL